MERTKFHEKLVRHCCQKRQQCRSNIVAGVDGALGNSNVSPVVTTIALSKIINILLNIDSSWHYILRLTCVVKNSRINKIDGRELLRCTLLSHTVYGKFFYSITLQNADRFSKFFHRIFSKAKSGHPSTSLHYLVKCLCTKSLCSRTE